MEQNESKKEALLREILEETGLQHVVANDDPIFLQAHYFNEKKGDLKNFWRWNDAYIFTCVASSEEI